MDGKQFHTRLRGIMVLLLAAVCAFSWVLYDLQIRQGAVFAAQSQRKIIRTETVSASRGQLLDRYGRVLVSNRTSYNVNLTLSQMDDPNDTILALIRICQKQEVTWADTLPLSTHAPFSLTTGLADGTAKRNFEGFLEKTGLTADSGSALLVALRERYGVDPGLGPADARRLVGVRYELELRGKEITYTPYIFAQDVDIVLITAVTEASLPGVSIDPTSLRQFHTSAGAHLLGQVGLMNSQQWEYYKEKGYPYNATVGQLGLEQAFEEYLHGTPGVKAMEVDTQGRVLNEYWALDEEGNPQEPIPGANVSITIDWKLQEQVEQILAQSVEGLESTDTQGAAAVVLDVRDAGVLSMASYPTYDPAEYRTNYQELSTDPLRPLINRATQGLYPPGSTFKMVVAAGGLEEGIIDRTTRVKCTGRYTYYDNPRDQPQCWIARQYGGSHGNETVTAAVKDSCNIFFFDLGRRLGIEKIGEYAALFGLGEHTGIELYEETGYVAGPERSEALGQTWYEGNVLSVSIGQENNQFTPLQICNYIATLANGGTHNAAHLLKDVTSGDRSQLLYQYQPQTLGTLELDQEDLGAITMGMLQVTTSGTAAPYFKDLDVSVAAKTGSAQVSAATESNALFVAYAPYEDPEIAVAIVVEKGGSGSTIASIAAEIFAYYFSLGDGLEHIPAENALAR